jgi:hypothetical protein
MSTFVCCAVPAPASCLLSFFLMTPSRVSGLEGGEGLFAPGLVLRFQLSPAAWELPGKDRAKGGT